MKNLPSILKNGSIILVVCLPSMVLLSISTKSKNIHKMLQNVDLSRLRVGKNIFTNRLRVLNNKFKLDWQNQTYEWFKLNLKTTFMPQWLPLKNSFQNNNDYLTCNSRVNSNFNKKTHLNSSQHCNKHHFQPSMF